MPCTQDSSELSTPLAPLGVEDQKVASPFLLIADKYNGVNARLENECCSILEISVGVSNYLYTSNSGAPISKY
jgi:hypothetical protein